MTAYSLAQEEMEKTLGFNLYANAEREITFDSKVWRIVKRISEERGLIIIRIEVYVRGREKPLSMLETMRILR